MEDERARDLMHVAHVSLSRELRGGIPVLASNVGGIPETVRIAHNGLLLEPDSSDAIVEAVERCLDDPGLLREMGCNALRDSSRFTPAAMPQQYFSLYRGIDPASRG